MAEACKAGLLVSGTFAVRRGRLDWHTFGRGWAWLRIALPVTRGVVEPGVALAEREDEQRDATTGHANPRR
jgi:hypothetical protein